MKTDISYGIIPFSQSSWESIEFLIIHQTNGYRGFPKGHKESGESDQQAALRELQEETWITNCRLQTTDSPLVVQYQFLDPQGHSVQKTVYYFLWSIDQTGKQQGKADKHEVDRLHRGTLEQTKKLLTHQNSKDLLDQAFLSIQKLKIQK